MIKRQHEYDLIANQINADLNNKNKGQPHHNKLLADHKLPSPTAPQQTVTEEIPDESGDGVIVASSTIMAESPEAKPKSAPSTSVNAGKDTKTPATGVTVKKGKSAKKKKRKSTGGTNGDDYDSDDFEEVIAQSIKVFDLKPPKAVKPSNQGNPRIANVKYRQ